jgi:hypothetical protein
MLYLLLRTIAPHGCTGPVLHHWNGQTICDSGFYEDSVFHFSFFLNVMNPDDHETIASGIRYLAVFMASRFHSTFLSL